MMRNTFDHFYFGTRQKAIDLENTKLSEFASFGNEFRSKKKLNTKTWTYYY